ncbi:hypothetical protein O3M35_012465 [Rhynocoris fuscipes]|uniref:Uncharacterized protein n=1 Tax=Rhynocoris fuscipes TaxID=488301 RepID=A0AAW1CY58_9HEMI
MKIIKSFIWTISELDGDRIKGRYRWMNHAVKHLDEHFGYEENTRTPLEKDGRLGQSDKGSAFNIYLPNMKMYKQEEKST